MSHDLWNFRFDRYGHAFHYQLHRKPGDALVIFLPSLRTPGLELIQYYQRRLWSNLLNASCLYISDPGLTKTVRGTWFQGNKDFFALESLSRDIRKICAEFGFDPAKTIIYGSSQGGFAALGLAVYLRKATAFAECPQIDLCLHDALIHRPLNQAAQACYGQPNMASVPPEYLYRTSLPDLFKRHDFIPHGTIWVKETDIHCLDEQLPRLCEFPADHFEINVFKGKLGEGGHSALPQDVVVQEIRRMLATGSRPSSGVRIRRAAKKILPRLGVGRLLAGRLRSRT